MTDELLAELTALEKEKTELATKNKELKAQLQVEKDNATALETTNNTFLKEKKDALLLKLGDKAEKYKDLKIDEIERLAEVIGESKPKGTPRVPETPPAPQNSGVRRYDPKTKEFNYV